MTRNMKIDANGTEIRVMGDNAFTLTPQQWIKATDDLSFISSRTISD